MPKIVIKESEVDANPPLIEEGNWNLVVKTLKQMIKNRETGRGPAKYSVKGKGAVSYTHLTLPTKRIV